MNDGLEAEVVADVPAIVDDKIVAIAEQAEKRIAAVMKIKETALKVTNKYDWTDQGGKPYLQVSGSEKVGRLFGVSWRLDEPKREDLGEGHFSYTFKGEFSLGGARIEVVGTRSSKDPFFSTRYEWTEKDGKKTKKKIILPASEVDSGNVKKGALTNCLGNGITRLLGIRNLTWEEVESVAGFTRAEVAQVQYGDKKKKGPSGTGSGPKGMATAAQVKKLCAMLTKEKIDHAAFKKANKVESFEELTKGRISKIFEEWEDTVKRFHSWEKLQGQAQGLERDEDTTKWNGLTPSDCPRAQQRIPKTNCQECPELEDCPGWESNE